MLLSWAIPQSTQPPTKAPRHQPTSVCSLPSLTSPAHGCMSHGKNRQGDVPVTTMAAPCCNWRRMWLLAMGMLISCPCCSLQCKPQPAAANTCIFLTIGLDDLSGLSNLNDSMTLREGACSMHSPSLLALCSVLSLACSHVLISPAHCGCISPSTSPHYMRRKPQLMSATVSLVSFPLHSFPSNGDKQLRFTASEGILF